MYFLITTKRKATISINSYNYDYFIIYEEQFNWGMQKGERNITFVKGFAYSSYAIEFPWKQNVIENFMKMIELNSKH